MKLTEKLRYRLLTGIFAVIALASLLFALVKLNEAERQKQRARIFAEEQLFECAAVARDSLKTIEGERLDEMPDTALILRLLHSAAGGKQSVAALPLESQSALELNRFFSSVEDVAAGETLQGLVEYAETLVSFLAEKRKKASTSWEGLPKFTLFEEEKSDSPVLGKFSEKEARALASHALGGNFNLSGATAQDGTGFVYVLSNAYIRVSYEGRVVELCRDLRYKSGVSPNLSQAEAESAAKAALLRGGYDRGGISVSSFRLENGIWFMQVETKETAPLTVGISAVSGAWCMLYESD